MDTIFISGLPVNTIIGIFDWEQQQPQPLLIDIEMDFDCRQAALSDNITDCIDYSRVSQIVIQLAEKHHCQLIECFAEQICQLIFAAFATDRIKVKINKPQAIPQAQAAGILIERKRPR